MFKKIIMTTTFLFVGVGVCYAAAPASVNSGLPWDNFITLMLREFSGPIPKIFATIATTLAGLSLLFGETQGLYKRFLQVVLAVSIAINAGDWINLVTNIDPDNSSAKEVPQLATSLTSATFLSDFMGYFIAVCQHGAYNLQKPMLVLLAAIATINLAVSTVFNFERDHIKHIFQETIRVGFYVLLVREWVGGSWGIADHLYSSFRALGIVAAGSTATAPDINTFITSAMDAFSTMWQATSWLGTGSLTVVIGNLFASFAMLIIAYLTVCEIVVTGIEFWIITTLSIPFMPFGVFKNLRYLFESVIGAIFSLGMKIMVVNFVGAVSFPVLLNMATSVSTAVADPNGSGLSAILRLLLACIVCYMLVKKTPELAQSLISGRPNLSGGDGVSAARGMGSTARNFASGTMALAGGMALASAMDGGFAERAGQAMPHGIKGTASYAVKGGIGTAMNMGRMMMAKATAPYHDSITGRLYNMQKRNENNTDLQRSVNGDGGASIRKRMRKNQEMPPRGAS